MSEITAIKAQAKRAGRVSIYLDGRYAFSLAKDQLAVSRLKVGQQLSPAQLAQFKHDSDYGKLRDNTYRWLSLRLRSRYEIEQYLRRKSSEPELTDRLLSQLEQQGYVDDAKFAAAWVNSRARLKPISGYRLKQELRQKGVPTEVIDETVNSAELDDVAAAKQIIASRRHRYSDNQKLMAYLARQGFSYDTIKRALE